MFRFRDGTKNATANISLEIYLMGTVAGLHRYSMCQCLYINVRVCWETQNLDKWIPFTRVDQARFETVHFLKRVLKLVYYSCVEGVLRIQTGKMQKCTSCELNQITTMFAFSHSFSRCIRRESYTICFLVLFLCLPVHNTEVASQQQGKPSSLPPPRTPLGVSKSVKPQCPLPQSHDSPLPTPTESKARTLPVSVSSSLRAHPVAEPQQSSITLPASFRTHNNQSSPVNKLPAVPPPRKALTVERPKGHAASSGGKDVGRLETRATAATATPLGKTPTSRPVACAKPSEVDEVQPWRYLHNDSPVDEDGNNNLYSLYCWIFLPCFIATRFGVLSELIFSLSARIFEFAWEWIEFSI